MSKKYLKMLFAAAVCAAGLVMSANDEKLAASINTTIDAFSVDKQKEEAAAKEFVSKATELFLGGQYLDAAKSYADAARIYQALMPNSEYFTDKYNKTQEMIAKAYYYLAQETALKAHEEANASDLDKAIALCKEAINIYPASAKEMNDRIAVYEKMRAAAAKRTALGQANIIPDFTNEQYQIKVLLKQARLLFYTGQYETARKRFQEVLFIDNICPEAVQGMKACDEKIKAAGDNRFRLTHKRAIVEAAWGTVLPAIKKQSEDKKVADVFDIKKNFAVEEDKETQKIREELKKEYTVTFDGDSNNAGTPLPEALKYLRDKTKVNFFLYMPSVAPSAPAEAPANDAGQLGITQNQGNAGGDDDDDDDDDSGNAPAPAVTQTAAVASSYPLVNLSLTNKPLKEIIDLLAKNTNMKYKIEKNAVIFAPKDAALDDMQIQVFPFDEAMLTALGGNPEPESIMENLKLDPNTDLEFPPGAKVMYDPKFRSLIVLNTPENLSKIEQTLLAIRQQDPPVLVQVQVKFVEIEQDDLKELGFIQSLGRPNGDTGGNGKPSGENNGRLQFDTNDNVINNSGKDTVVFSRSENSYDYNLVVNAVNQMNTKDILSSPKVLTDDGKKVTIKMVSERYFAWEWEEGDTESSTEGGVTITSVTPPWPEFEKQELGITMEVTPKVDKENRLIMMDIQPWVTAHVGWTVYQYIDENGTETEITRPIISERHTSTNVTIYNEETVVVGGMIKDFTQTINDKVPFLGDIPLLGNFFKSKSSTVKKTNLLIFVTARMLKPNGMPYFPSDTVGKPSSAGIGDIY